ncbi:MAG: hypothetical protein A4S09_00780 [Proteobacteria bacterium SG_bin7]|nr:MAG: hypothetical protein A4S09_00780 [Proteobacteria bacterium SG_bin7]
MKNFFGVMFTFLFSLTSHAVGSKTYSYDKYLSELKAAPIAGDNEYPFFDEKAAAMLKPKLNIEAQRKIAQASELSEKSMSTEAQKIIQEISDIDSTDNNTNAAEELHDLIQNYSKPKKYSALPTDAQLIIAQLASLSPFRGILWRIRPYFEKARITHTAALTAFKNLAANLRWSLRSPQTKLAFRYISEPYTEISEVPAVIDTDAKFYTWLLNDVNPHLQTAAKRLNAIPIDSAKPLVWDNRILLGPNTFKDGIDRFKWVGEVERMMLVASYENSISQIYFFGSYSNHKFIELAKELGKLFGVDSLPLPFMEVQGVTLKQYREVIKNSDFQNFGTRLSTCTYSDKPCMELSYNYLLSATERMYAAWKTAQKREGNNIYAFNTNFAQVDIARGDINFENIRSLVKQRTMLRSLATGEPAEFDLPAFYKTPPQDLKKLLPTGFDEKKERTKTLKVGATSKTESYRNYFYGSPQTWNHIEEYKTFLPKVASSDDILQAGRVLTHATFGLVRIPGLNLAEQ